MEIIHSKGHFSDLSRGLSILRMDFTFPRGREAARAYFRVWVLEVRRWRVYSLSSWWFLSLTPSADFHGNQVLQSEKSWGRYLPKNALGRPCGEALNDLETASSFFPSVRATHMLGLCFSQRLSWTNSRLGLPPNERPVPFWFPPNHP